MLNFLIKLPDRYLLIIGFFAVMIFYSMYQNDAILQLMINFAVAIIALSQKKQDPQTQITTDTVQTDSVDTDSIDNSTVNTGTINLKGKGKTI